MIYFKATDNALFAGTEQEGPFKGTYTVFVVGEVNIGLIDDSIKDLQNRTGMKVCQLYLGAGFLSKCGPAYVRLVARFLETDFEDSLVLTVEASYLDVKLLRDVGRIDHWVYTAMMLGSTNPNYLQTMQVLTNTALQERMGLTADLLNKVSLKTDFCGTTMVVAAKDVAYSRYADYGDDTLLWTSYGTDHTFKVPHPKTQCISADPKKTEVLDLTKLDPKATDYEVTIAWPSKMIFRSQGNT